jgi:dCMP deaminase
MTEKEYRYHRLHMDVAKRVAKMSYAERTKVGSVLVKDGSILAYGFNGTPAGMSNVCEDIVDGVLVTKPEVQHAELNMFMKMLKSGISPKGGSLYVTLCPCLTCSKLVSGSGVKEVFYDAMYWDDAGLKFLKDSGVKVEKL